ncbi:hypothetical protein NA2_15894, partial [Nitratireductor pacificus pht-3B]
PIAPAPVAPQEPPRARPAQPAEPRLPAEPSIQIAETTADRGPATLSPEPRATPQLATGPVTAGATVAAAPVAAAAVLAPTRPIPPSPMEEPVHRDAESTFAQDTMDELSEALDHHVSQERAKADPSLEDEMSKLLEELSDERK